MKYVLVFVVLLFSDCSNKFDHSRNFVNLISQSNEFKSSENIIDSVNSVSPVIRELSISIIHGDIYGAGDSTIMTGHINMVDEIDDRTLFAFRYDKKLKSLVSIEKIKL